MMKRYQIKRDRATYINCILAMIILMIIAVLGPQLLFAVQDNHKQGEIFMGERSQLDVTALNVGYPKVLRERLLNFAEGKINGKQYYATITDCTVDAEGYSILDNVLNHEWVTFLNDVGILWYDYENISKIGYNIEEWKRYVIYDENFENGVAFMAWYFTVTINDGMTIQLLVDVEDDTLYQLKVTFDDTLREWERYGYTEWEYFYSDMINTFFLYWRLYYDVNDFGNASYEEYLQNFGYFTDYGEKKKIYSEKENVSIEEVFPVYGDVMINDDSVYLQQELPYGENSLYWKMKVLRAATESESTEGKMEITMGIEDIVELVPEFSNS